MTTLATARCELCRSRHGRRHSAAAAARPRGVITRAVGTQECFCPVKERAHLCPYRRSASSAHPPPNLPSGAARYFNAGLLVLRPRRATAAHFGVALRRCDLGAFPFAEQVDASQVNSPRVSVSLSTRGARRISSTVTSAGRGGRCRGHSTRRRHSSRATAQMCGTTRRCGPPSKFGNAFLFFGGTCLIWQVRVIHFTMAKPWDMRHPCHAGYHKLNTLWCARRTHVADPEYLACTYDCERDTGAGTPRTPTLGRSRARYLHLSSKNEGDDARRAPLLPPMLFGSSRSRTGTPRQSRPDPAARRRSRSAEAMMVDHLMPPRWRNTQVAAN